MNYTLSNMDDEFLAFFAHSRTNTSVYGEMFNSLGLPISLYNTKCLGSVAQLGLSKDVSGCVVTSQDKHLIKYNYSIANVSVDGNAQYIVQTSEITIANTTFTENYTNPIIVYHTTSSDSFTGDIVHRVVAAIRSGNQYYLLTQRRQQRRA